MLMQKINKMLYRNIENNHVYKYTKNKLMQNRNKNI